jgi:hypothetical protein
MRCVPFYACCGAYFLCDITKESIEDPNLDPNNLPQVDYTETWGGRSNTYKISDYSKAGLAFHVNSHQSIAYLLAILKPEETEIASMLEARGFKLLSKGPTRLLYCLSKQPGRLKLALPEAA